MNKKMIFDYQLAYNTILFEKENYCFDTLDEIDILKIAQGKIFIFFEEPKRDLIIIEASLPDYLKQIKFVISDLENGNPTAFSVSTDDWYSNNIRFSFDQKTGILRILEIHNHDFDIQTDLTSFKKEFNKFSKSCINDIQNVYPSLIENPIFLKMKQDGSFFF